MEENKVNITVKNRLSHDNFKEAYRHYYFKRPLSIVVLFVLLFYIAVACAVLTYCAEAESRFDPKSCIVLVIFAALLLSRIYQSASFAKIGYKRQLELGTPEEYIITIDKDTITSDFDSVSIPTSHVRNAYVTKNLIYIVTTARHIIMLCRDGFGEGDEVRLVELLDKNGAIVYGKRKLSSLPECDTAGTNKEKEENKTDSNTDTASPDVKKEENK